MQCPFETSFLFTAMDMKLLVILHCLNVCCLGFAVLTGCGTSLINPIGVTKVAGGKSTLPHQYPFMVSLQTAEGNMHFCGGSVLNDNWILTAAHCLAKFHNNPGDIRAVVGLHKLSEGTRRCIRHMKLSKVVIHKDYNKVNHVNDIALLKIDKPINMAESEGSVNAICLPDAESPHPVGIASVIGWGRDPKYAKKTTDILSETVVPIVSNELCNAAYYIYSQGKLYNSMVCAGEDNHDACMNDSGGPLFQKTNEGVSTIIGIVSHGSPCGSNLTYPGVYTKVASFIPWIQEVMETN